MMLPFLQEEIVSLSKFVATPQAYLRGVVRVVDRKDRSVGVFLDRDALAELREALESNSPEFLEKLSASRSSGRVSSSAIRKRLKL